MSVVIFLIFNQKDEKDIFKISQNKVRGDTSIPNRYNHLAEKYLTTELERGHAMAAKAAFFSKSIGYTEGEARAYFILSQYNMLNNNDEKAVEYADRAYNAYIKVNDYKGATLSKQIEGRIFLKHEMFEQAQDVYKSSLNIAKELANNELMAICYVDFGSVLMAKKNYFQAIEYFKKANKIFAKIKDKKGMAVCYTDLGLTYKAERKYHDATIAFEKALALLPNEDNQKAFVYLEAGTVELNKFNHVKAIDYFKKAEVIESAHEDNFDLAATLYKQAETYMEMTQLDLALSTGMRGAEIAKLVGNKEVQRDLYAIISEIYNRKKDYRHALEYLKSSSLMDNEIRSETQVKQLSKRQASLEFNKKLEQEKVYEQKLQEELNEQMQNHYLMIGMFIPLLVTLLFFISKINISANYIRAIVFVTIILILEFLLVVLDPLIDKYTGGIPISKLIINTILALMLSPLQHIMERYIKKRVLEARLEEKKSPILT
ncbi:MAG TPA: tetratricopeptide repeat protein [Cytophagales bacterium]|nr:tetratricopeptide repeat protein [Cytophagales bacterium]